MVPPVFKLAASRKKQPKNYLFSAEEGLASFETAGLRGFENEHPPFPNVDDQRRCSIC